ncbi:MAG: NUDIX domain-containing protein [Anaerolineaceae bacterium]
MTNTNYAGYEQTSVTVDLVIFTVYQDSLKALLVRRATEPYNGKWSIPGGFLLAGESLEGAAERVMEEKTGVREVYLEQLYTFGRPDRDPRARVITVTYFALIPWKRLVQPGSNRVADTAWFAVDDMPELAFDHNEILSFAAYRLRAKAGYSSIGYGLLPEAFRLSDLQKVYEVIMGRSFDKRNFRKRMLSSGLLEETGHRELSGAHRPAMLFTFKQQELVFYD